MNHRSSFIDRIAPPEGISPIYDSDVKEIMIFVLFYVMVDMITRLEERVKELLCNAQADSHAYPPKHIHVTNVTIRYVREGRNSLASQVVYQLHCHDLHLINSNSRIICS